jgi:hypothetical protein
MIRLALKGTALVAIFGLAATSRLLDAVRLEIEYRVNGPTPVVTPSPMRCGHGKTFDQPCDRCTPAPNQSALDELGGRHDGGASGRWGG